MAQKHISGAFKDLDSANGNTPQEAEKLVDGKSSYHALNTRQLSPPRLDAFKATKNTEPSSARGYVGAMRQAEVEREIKDLEVKAQKRARETGYHQNDEPSNGPEGVRRKRWDDEGPVLVSEWDDQPKSSGPTNGQPTLTQNNAKMDNPPLKDFVNDERRKRNRWDETPARSSSSSTASNKNRWDETPSRSSQDYDGKTPTSSKWDATPAASSFLETPVPMSPVQEQSARAQLDIDYRNRELSDEELNRMIPTHGFTVLEPPPSYNPIRTPARKLLATPTPQHQGFHMQEEYTEQAIPYIEGVEGLSYFKADDAKHFSGLLEEAPEASLSMEQLKSRKIMRLLLKIKNGQPSYRKVAMRQLTENAALFGAGPLLDQILPLMMSPSLEDQERHLLVKVIDRVLFKLDSLVRPYTHKILVVVQPLLIDEDYHTRVEGREVISNLSKAVGLATMISTLRPDIDSSDEYVRNTTSRAFAVVGSALGVDSLLPFLRAVCKSKKSWEARHTGIKIIQQLSILLGSGVLPFLGGLVSCVSAGLVDENLKVRIVSGLTVSTLAESCFPYGFESFRDIVPDLLDGLRRHRGKTLAAFLKATGFVVPLFPDSERLSVVRVVGKSVLGMFDSPDPEMKLIVLKVLMQVLPDLELGVVRDCISSFFANFWTRRAALEKRGVKILIDATVALGGRIGLGPVLERLVPGLKDESEPFRRVSIDAVSALIKEYGTSDVDNRLEEVLIDAALFAFQEQLGPEQNFVVGFGIIANSFGARIKSYLPQIVSTILWRLNNKSANVRQMAADLISQIADVMQLCGDDKLMGQLGVVLYEYLGEEYPEVLGSIINALKSIVNVIGMPNMTPPIKDLLPRLTPILKNRHEKVQEHVVDLVGRIADRGAEFVSAREWMRICFELLEMLKAPRKGIRRAAINTFGYIAKAIGPQDVLTTLLNNLKVQERQSRLCTTVAIAIVAETCSPFTILPALMNEYRVPEMNVQNGVLKSLSFLFEYTGEMSKDYIWAVTPLLEDALIDRDLVHRQTACSAVKHMALGAVGLGFEDCFLHLLNLIWPNILEVPFAN